MNSEGVRTPSISKHQQISYSCLKHSNWCAAVGFCSVDTVRCLHLCLIDPFHKTIMIFALVRFPGAAAACSIIRLSKSRCRERSSSGGFSVCKYEFCYPGQKDFLPGSQKCCTCSSWSSSDGHVCTQLFSADCVFHFIQPPVYESQGSV